MTGNLPLSVSVIIAIVLTLSFGIQASTFWQAPFDTINVNNEPVDSLLTLDDVLALVATENRTLQALRLQLQAADGNLLQAGLWSNPELEIELEEIGWDASGLNESELIVSISQEFEFFGQRRARKNVARAGIEAVSLRGQMSGFDLYLRTKQRFYSLAHARQEVFLFLASVELAREIVENIEYRVEKGTALQSELLLAQLEEQRAQMVLDQALQEANVSEANLVALWGGVPSGISVLWATEPDLTTLLAKLSTLGSDVDSTYEVLNLQSESSILKAERMLAIAEARPTVTLTGGFKRLEIDGAKSFHFGFSLPIPLLNKNQGIKQSIGASLRSLQYRIDQAEHEAHASLHSHKMQLGQLINRHATLDSVLIPTVEKAYKTLKSTYEAGRLPYAHLLEAKRALNEFNCERNDLLLAIYEQIITIESITGIVLRTDKEE